MFVVNLRNVPQGSPLKIPSVKQENESRPENENVFQVWHE